MKLGGRVALVTGAAQGIGETVALALAEQGANIAVNDVNLLGAQKVAEAIEVWEGNLSLCRPTSPRIAMSSAWSDKSSIDSAE